MDARHKKEPDARAKATRRVFWSLCAGVLILAIPLAVWVVRVERQRLQWSEMERQHGLEMRERISGPRFVSDMGFASTPEPDPAKFGELEGRVVDATGAPVVGALVGAEGVVYGLARVGTDSAGHFKLGEIAAGEQPVLLSWPRDDLEVGWVRLGAAVVEAGGSTTVEYVLREDGVIFLPIGPDESDETLHVQVVDAATNQVLAAGRSNHSTGRASDRLLFRGIPRRPVRVVFITRFTFNEQEHRMVPVPVRQIEVDLTLGDAVIDRSGTPTYVGRFRDTVIEEFSRTKLGRLGGK